MRRLRQPMLRGVAIGGVCLCGGLSISSSGMWRRGGASGQWWCAVSGERAGGSPASWRAHVVAAIW